MRKSSHFQDRVENFVAELCRKRGLAASREEHGDRERAIKISVPQLGLELWLYDDGANILAKDRDDRFEIADFDDLHQLESSLTQSLQNLLIDYRID